ncbi:hypothetical protein PGB90_000582 [Kerria lacca]
MISKDDNPLLANLTFKLALNTASHPFEYAKVLIQIGHEPLAPYPTKTLFKKPALGLPNVIEYVKYIKQVDGIRGCYRGLFSRLVCNSINLVTCKKMSDISTKYSWKFIPCPPPDIPEEQLNETDKWLKLWQETMVEITSKTAGVIASQPLHVITLRIMAQFVGREIQYSGIGSSIIEIYKNDGILGFFSGLIPRLFGEVLLSIFVNVCIFLAKNMIKDNEVMKLSSIPIAIVGTAFTYPFHVVSTCMTVNCCGLAAGNPPQMPIYSSWIECWRHLSRTDQLNRGSSMFFRYYKGPHVSATGYHNFVIKKDY